jgi:hypothetical protein
MQNDRNSASERSASLPRAVANPSGGRIVHASAAGCVTGPSSCSASAQVDTCSTIASSVRHHGERARPGSSPSTTPGSRNAQHQIGGTIAAGRAAMAIVAQAAVVSHARRTASDGVWRGPFIRSRLRPA